MKQKRIHLDSTIQPTKNWRTIPFNSYYEAHPSGLIRNRKSKKLIKGNQARKKDKLRTSHEFVYFLIPKKTTYTRASVIAKTFPDLVTTVNSNVLTGHVCFKDGNMENCSVENLFVSNGTVQNKLYCVNGTYCTAKDMETIITNWSNQKVAKSVYRLIYHNKTKSENKDYLIVYENGKVTVLEKATMNLFEFDVEVKDMSHRKRIIN